MPTDPVSSTPKPADAAPGPRRVPERVSRAPTGVDPDTAALAAAPNSPLSVLGPQGDDEWRATAASANAEWEHQLANDRIKLAVTIEPVTVASVRAFSVVPAKLPARHQHQLVMHLHGGGFVFGAGESSTQEAAFIAAYGGYHVLAVDYRMPPDAPFPAGLDDAVAVWRALTESHDPCRLAIDGTSAGSNLALALLLRCKAEGLPMPGAAAIGSPAADLTRAGDTMRTSAGVDNVVGDPDGYVEAVYELYSRGRDRTDPLLSPLYGDYGGFPPTTLIAGTRDILLSDTVRVHRKLRRAGVVAELQVYEALSHAQYLSAPVGSSLGREVYGEVTRFFDTHLAC